MTYFKNTNVKNFTKSNLDVTPDNIHWKNFNAPVLVKEFGPIDYIHFSPKEPHHFAVTCSCKVQIYNSITKVVTKSFNKFQEITYGANFRRDEKLLCAGGDGGVIRLFDVNTRSPLRIFLGHAGSVHRTYFTLDGMHIVSFSDDKTSILWDIATEKKLIIFREHYDYVRAGSISPVSSNVYISGGYDKIINMYDTRTNKKIFLVDHDAPVESLVFLPSGGVFLSAGGTEIRVWDCLTNGRLLAKISSHSKTVTCLQTACNGQRILSGSLDKHVKIYDSGTYKITHTLDYPNSVISLGTSINNETIVVGMVDGLLSIRQKEHINEKVSCSQNVLQRCTGENLYSRDVNVYVHDAKKDIMGKHDICLRKFQYSKALDSVMINYIVNKSPQVTVYLFQELIRRQGLHYALAGRDGKSLNRIFKFITRYISNMKFQRILVYIANVVIDVYENKIEELHFMPYSMFKNLSRKLHELQDFILSLIELQGAFETILSAAEILTMPFPNYSYELIPSEKAQENLILNLS